jgi:D-tyrosyl-tRNA(Tyr) deacylase
MLALIQRVTGAGVSIQGKTVATIGNGCVVLLGVRKGDTPRGSEELAERSARLRIFPDEEGKMNRSLLESGGSALVVSQFTLCADTRRGNRPGFSDAAPPSEAEPLYLRFVERLRSVLGTESVATGTFGAMMDVSIVNSGPVTILLESRDPSE